MRSMRMKLYLAAVLIQLIPAAGIAQYYMKSYDLPPYTTRTELGYSIERTFIGTISGGWSIAGITNTTPNAGSFDWLFLKLNSSGSVLCRTVLGFPLGDSCFTHVQLDNPSKTTVLGGFYRAPNGKEKASVSFIDSSCGHIISKQILDSLRHEFRASTKNPSNEVTLAGYIQTFVAGAYRDRILAAQWTSAGALLWAFNYLPPYSWIDERAFGICYQPSDGTYGITGITNRFTGPGGPFQVFVMKVSAAGIPVWFRGFSMMPGAPSTGREIIAMPDGGFVVSGWSPAFDPMNDVFVVRVSAAGALLWENVYGMPGVTELSYSIIYQASDASLVYTGYVLSSTEDILLAKITAGGIPVWTKRFPDSTGNGRGYDLKEAFSPAGYAVTGQVFHPLSLGFDPVLTRTDAVGNVNPGCTDSVVFQARIGNWSEVCSRNIFPLTDVQVYPSVVNPVPIERGLCNTLTGVNSFENETPNSFALMQNYPNPFNPATKIRYQVAKNSDVLLQVFDITGRLAATLVKQSQQQGSYEVDFDGTGFSSGVYFYKLQSDGFEETKKMLLVK